MSSVLSALMVAEQSRVPRERIEREMRTAEVSREQSEPPARSRAEEWGERGRRANVDRTQGARICLAPIRTDGRAITVNYGYIPRTSVASATLATAMWYADSRIETPSEWARARTAS